MGLLGVVVLLAEEHPAGFPLLGHPAGLESLAFGAALLVHLFPGDFLDHRLFQVHHKQAEQEKQGEGHQHLQTGVQGDVV